MNDSLPVISVITICRNEVNSIPETIETVFLQDKSVLEYIVVDGASTDGTAEYLKSIESQINTLISEKDKGIYDAMNKGLKVATGELVYFLNGGDRFYDSNVLTLISKYAKANEHIDIIHGKLAFSNSKDDIFYKDDNKFELNSLYDLFRNNHLQQCFFIRKRVFDEIGLLNDQYKFVADSEFIIRAVKHKKKFSYLPSFFCIFDTNGISGRNPLARLKEKRIMIYKTAPISTMVGYFFRGILEIFIKNE